MANDKKLLKLKAKHDGGKLQAQIDEIARLRKELRDSHRVKDLFRHLEKVIREAPPAFDCEPLHLSTRKHKITETAILQLSDSHADQQILPERVQDLENYNFEVACRRGERLVDTAISHMAQNLPNYRFEHLIIAAGGDYTSGDIHASREHSKWGNAIKNAMGVGALIAAMITDLASQIKRITIISVAGNHGRRSKKKDYRGAHNNWDFLTMMYAKALLKDYVRNGRVEFIVPDSYTVAFSVYGYNFTLSHGDDVRSWNSIPWYGIERRTRRMAAIAAVQGKALHYNLYAHFHQQATQQHTTGETLINGAWTATDEYALESLGGYGKPYQRLFGVHPKYGITWRMPIQLRVPDWLTEERRAGRYNIDIFEQKVEHN